MPRTYWHITFGTYGDRLHGDDRPTVDRKHNQFDTPFLATHPERNEHEQTLLISEVVVLTSEQQRFIESIAPDICERGGWDFIACAAGTNHVHVMLRVDELVHGKRVRALFKRWLTQALNARYPKSKPPIWWTEGGSTKVVKDDVYLVTAKQYVEEQRASK